VADIGLMLPGMYWAGLLAGVAEAKPLAALFMSYDAPCPTPGVAPG
jgi:hypothetical protein